MKVLVVCVCVCVPAFMHVCVCMCVCVRARVCVCEFLYCLLTVLFDTLTQESRIFALNDQGDYDVVVWTQEQEGTSPVNTLLLMKILHYIFFFHIVICI